MSALGAKADVRGSKRTSMKQAFEIEIPRTLEDVCNARHLALLVYDMQVGIKRQVKEGEVITAKIREILEAPVSPKCVCSSPATCPYPKSLWAHSNFV